MSLPGKRILAIDYGLKRVGFAISDPMQIIATPLFTLLNDGKFWQNLKKIFDEYEIEKIVLGYPLKENGQPTDATDAVLKFEKELKKNYQNIEIELLDERYTSLIAKEIILQNVKSKKKRRNKALVDKNAAAVLLDEYLNR